MLIHFCSLRTTLQVCAASCNGTLVVCPNLQFLTQAGFQFKADCYSRAATLGCLQVQGLSLSCLAAQTQNSNPSLPCTLFTALIGQLGLGAE